MLCFLPLPPLVVSDEIIDEHDAVGEWGVLGTSWEDEDDRVTNELMRVTGGGGCTAGPEAKISSKLPEEEVDEDTDEINDGAGKHCDEDPDRDDVGRSEGAPPPPPPLIDERLLTGGGGEGEWQEMRGREEKEGVLAAALRLRLMLVSSAGARGKICGVCGRLEQEGEDCCRCTRGVIVAVVFVAGVGDEEVVEVGGHGDVGLEEEGVGGVTKTDPRGVHGVTSMGKIGFCIISQRLACGVGEGGC